MTTAHFVKAAAKDYPKAGIKKGDSYYWWKFKQRYGNSPRLMSKTRPRPSQLTQSEYLSQALALQERIEDLTPDATLPDDLESIISDLRTLSDEQDEKFNNMPEGLQQGDTGQLLEQRRDACNEFADALEGIDIEEFEADLSAKDECSECNGTGKVDSEPDGEDCPECLGDGEVDKDDPVNSDGDTEEEYWQWRLDEVQNESFDIE